MSDSYSQVYLQIVLAVKNKHCFIYTTWEDQLYKYLTGAFQFNGHQVIAINGMPDHVHILIGMKLNGNFSDTINEIKRSSSQWINQHRLSVGHFQWQEGYGVFSYSQSSIDTVVNYIHNQKYHHTKQSFRDEYKSLLNKFNINYQEEYIFESV